jgi:hypothetical protein
VQDDRLAQELGSQACFCEIGLDAQGAVQLSITPAARTSQRGVPWSAGATRVCSSDPFENAYMLLQRVFG